jgi:hypothetical protein
MRELLTLNDEVERGLRDQVVRPSETSSSAPNPSIRATVNCGTHRCNRTGPSHDPSANRSATGLMSKAPSPVVPIRKN